MKSNVKKLKPSSPTSELNRVRERPVFNITQIDNLTPYARALRESVVIPAFNFTPEQVASVRSTRKAIRDLVSKRYGLTSYLWGEKLISDVTWNTIVRCPPTGCHVEGDKLRTCNRFYICPFCWQRSVTKPCADKFLALCGPHTFQDRFPGREWDDIGLQISQEEYSYTPQSLEEALEMFQEQGKIAGSNMSVSYLGSYSAISMIPREEDWLARRTVLAVVDMKKARSTLRYHKNRVDEHLSIGTFKKPHLVAQMIGIACAYPPEYLSWDDGNDALCRFLNLNAKYHETGRRLLLHTFTGILRRKSGKKRSLDNLKPFKSGAARAAG